MGVNAMSTQVRVPSFSAPAASRPSRCRVACVRAVPDVQHAAPAPPASGQVIQHSLEHTASVSRVLMSGPKPNLRLRNALSHRLTPITIAVGAAYASTVVVGAFRSWAIEHTRSCKTCGGYSIHRCDLCGAAGTIAWDGKWTHLEPCPKCLGKRYVRCKSCGGWHAHALFQHLSRGPLDMQQTLQPSTVDEELRNVKQDLALD